MKVKVFDNLEEVSKAAAQYLVKIALQCVETQGVFTIALAGGETPATLYRYLAQEPFLGQFPWANTHFFWGDERYVPYDHPDSNYGNAIQALALSSRDIPPQNIHPIPTNTLSPQESAAQYETILLTVLQHQGLSALDAVVLGLGTDGHTASLFPGNGCLEEKICWTATAVAPNGQPRITLTCPAINSAQVVLFLVAGEAKKEKVQEIINPADTLAPYPAAKICPRKELIWFLDKTAAQNLRS